MSTVVNPIVDPRGGYSAQNSTSQTPRAVVVLAGFRFLVNSLEVVENAHGALDTASCVMPINSNPDFSKLLQTNIQDGAVPALVYIGFPNATHPGSTDLAQLQLRFQGIIDTLEPKFAENEVEITMRSNGALLELTKIISTSLNETTAAFVTNAAKLVGLTPNIQFDAGYTPSLLSEVYGHDFMVGMHNLRLWDTIIKCAEMDDVDAWVSGKTLNYVSPDKVKRTTVHLQYGHDIVTFDGKHSPQFNRNIKVRVVTYSRRLSQSHTVHWTYDPDGNLTFTDTTRETSTQALFGTNGSIRTTNSVNGSGDATGSVTDTDSSGGRFNTGATSIPSESSAETYDEYIPNLTPEKANDYGKKLALQISRTEFAATFTIIPNYQNFSKINIQTYFQVNGLPYQNWNTSPKFPYYWPRRITTKFTRSQDEGESDGLSMEIEALNHRLPSAAV